MAKYGDIDQKIGKIGKFSNLVVSNFVQAWGWEALRVILSNIYFL